MAILNKQDFLRAGRKLHGVERFAVRIRRPGLLVVQPVVPPVVDIGEEDAVRRVERHGVRRAAALRGVGGLHGNVVFALVQQERLRGRSVLPGLFDLRKRFFLQGLQRPGTLLLAPR